MKKFTTFVFAALGALVLTGCKPAVKDTFTVTFDTHGGSAVAEMKDVKVVEEEPVTTLARHEFKGWFEDADYTGERLTFPYNVTKDITLHAKWNELKYTVTFDTNEGTAVDPMNVSIIETSPVTTRDGYSFDGWFTSNDAATPITFPYVVDHTQTLYAKWTLITYLVTFDANGGSTVTSQDTALIETSPVTTRTGYNFLGWFTSDEATAAVTFPYKVTSAQTLHARWERDTSVVLINGYADEDIWTSTVMGKYVTVALNDDYSSKIFALKNDNGVYIYVEHRVAQTRTHESEWWSNNNIEFRFGSELDTPYAGDVQYWYSSLNGGSGSHGTVAYVDAGMDGDLHKLQFEIMIPWDQMPNGKEANLLFSAGVAYATGFGKTVTWDRVRADQFSDFDMITATGVAKYEGIANFFSRTGTELLAEPVAASGDGWNSIVVSKGFDGNDDFEVRIDLHTEAIGGGNDCGFVAEVFSPGWANGGVTFRQDWWGWGSWHRGPDVLNDRVHEGNSGPHGEGTVAEGDVFNAMKKKDVTLFVAFNHVTGRIAVRGIYTSTVEDFSGQTVYVNFYTRPVSYRGDMNVSVGFFNASVNITSFQLISGTAK